MPYLNKTCNLSSYTMPNKGMKKMEKTVSFVLIVLISGFFFGCASSIVDGEYIKTSSSTLTPKEKDAVINIYRFDKKSERPATEVGRVSARAWVLEKGINELKIQDRKIGADAIIKALSESLKRISV